MKRRETGGIRKRGAVWWIHYRVDGERYFESAETGDERAARSLLAQRRREIREGTWKPPSERAVTETLTTRTFIEGWIEARRENGVRNWRDESHWMKAYVLPTIGDMPLKDVKRTHVRDLISALTRGKSERTGKPYSPRTILHVYRTLVTAFADAVLAEKITTSPCTLRTRKGELPRMRDADPKWRASAVYTRDEAETLLSSEDVPIDRRAMYGLMMLAGLRSSEATGRTWRDYDPTAEPLGRLTVATQADGTDADRETKTGETRDVPVHPTLAALLAEWKLSGFPMMFGRHPRPGDPIVPSSVSPRARLKFRSPSGVYEQLARDLKRLELRRVPSLRHAMRATFLSLLEIDGANMAIAR